MASPLLIAPGPLIVLSRAFIASTYGAFPLLVVLYFLPTAVARRRRIRNDIGVILLNLLFGWTLIGWLAALAWAGAGAPSPRHIGSNLR